MQFDTVTDWLRFIERPTTMLARDRSSLTGTREFTDTDTLEEAIGLARKGWKDGTAKITAMTADITKRIDGQLPKPSYVPSRKGGSFMMGKVLEGHPNCRIRKVDLGERIDAHNAKIVRLVVNVSASGGIGTDAFIRRGAAAAVVASVLQRRGQRVSIDVVRCVSTGYNSTAQHEVRVRVKREQEAISLEKIAFLLGHASTLRRLMWSTVEHEPDATRARFGFGKDYGGYGLPAESENKGDIYIGRILSASDWSDKFAMAWITKTLSDQGIILKGI